MNSGRGLQQTLIFDLGGVLIANDMFDELRRLMRVPADSTELKARWLRSPAARTFELGQCSVADFSAAVVTEFDLTVSPTEFIQRFSGWPKGFYPGMTDMLASLRPTCRIGCLSNSNAVHWTGRFTDPFDVAYSSHLMQRIKPDPDVFAHVTRDLGLQPADIIFFDDAEPNIEAAKDYGWRAHHTDGPDALLQVLQGLGLVSDNQA